MDTDVPALTASLPMYNLPEMRERNASFWQAVAAEAGISGHRLPDGLSFERPPVPERIGPDVVFSQTCGYPLRTIYRGQARLLGTPTYDAPGCGPGTHRAFILVRESSAYDTLQDLRGTAFALNSRHSNSGMNLPRLLFARLADRRPFFGSVVETGSHPASMQRVKAGELDACSVDCLTFAFFRDHRPEAVVGLRVVAETCSSPTIPFITAAATPSGQVEALRAALLRVAADPARRKVLEALRIREIAPADVDSYEKLLDIEREAARLGYPELA